MQATARAAAGPSVTGYLDAVNDTRIYGWAWDPERPEARIAIRFQVGSEIVAALVADAKRQDLAANRIGDGAHAFETTLPEGTNANAVRVLAVCPHSGETVELHQRGVIQEAALGPQVQGAIEALLRSQRMLHRNLNQIMLRLEEKQSLPEGDAPPPPGAVAPEDSAELRKQLDAFELFMVRVDEALRDQASAIARLKETGHDRLARGFSGLAAILAAVAALATLVH